MNICAKAPFCCFQSQSEVFCPDGSCLAMKSVVSCMKQSVAAAQQDFRLKNIDAQFCSIFQAEETHLLM